MELEDFDFFVLEIGFLFEEFEFAVFELPFLLHEVDLEALLFELFFDPDILALGEFKFLLKQGVPLLLILKCATIFLANQSLLGQPFLVRLETPSEAGPGAG